MDFWTAIVCIVFIVVCMTDLVERRRRPDEPKPRSRRARRCEELDLAQEIHSSLTQMEKRLEALETILIEKTKWNADEAD